MIQKLLIANRGEIAVRIIRACREMGIETVAVYSKADKDALHTQLADEAICIGETKASESYLNMESIISATIATGADAIHPGFGFLSENSKFARLCEQCNIIFIGPKSDVMYNLGNKSVARKTMIEANVPVIPGSEEQIYDSKTGKKIADQVGYPVIIKAALGGGGKGMRVAYGPEEFEQAFNAAKKESEAAFDDGTMYIEHFVENPRHIEFQILADELRKKMGDTAVRAAKAAKYENAGTIEFLLDKDKFYFMEMNTRIQVEHPVTETVTGIDLIKEQIKIADGQPLSYKQKDIKINGHAIECRINAENPLLNFRPSPGVITDLYLPGGNGVRIDSAVYNGYEVTPYYDSMLAKLIVHGENREEAIKKMISALGEVIVEGIDTNVDYLYGILNDSVFQSGHFDVNFIENFNKNIENIA